MKIKFKKLKPQAVIPRFAHSDDSGMDLFAIEDKTLLPGTYENVSTGIAAEIPAGYELQVRPRSGLAFHSGIIAALGTVDEGYRGEIRVCLYNHSFSTYRVLAGERIAQIVLAPVVRPEIEEVDQLSTVTDRGVGGFGSTGK